MSIFLGSQTLVAAVLAYFFLGTPGEVRWLDQRQKVVAYARVMKNHAGTDRTGTKGWDWKQAGNTFKDPVFVLPVCR